MLQKFIHVTPQYNFRIILQPGPELCRVDQHLRRLELDGSQPGSDLLEGPDPHVSIDAAVDVVESIVDHHQPHLVVRGELDVFLECWVGVDEVLS